MTGGVGGLSGRLGGLLRHGVVRNVGLLVSGTVLAQVITALAAPVLTRLYGPEAFGILGLFTAVVAVAGVAATLRYELAIVLPETDEEAVNVLGLSVGVSLLLAVVSALAIWIAGAPLAELLGSSALTPFLWWVPVSVLGMGIYQALDYWTIRRNRFRRISISRVVRAGSASGLQVGSGLAGAAAGGLVLGQVAGQLAATVALTYQALRDDLRPLLRLIRPATLRKVMREYREFPMFSAPQALANSLSQNLPVVLLSAFFGPAVGGLYLLSHRLLKLPLFLISGAVRQALFQRASAVRRDGGDTYRLLVRYTAVLAALAAIPTIAVILFGPPVFAFALGAEWRPAGVYAQWLIVGLYAGFINPPAVVLAQIHRKQKQFLYYDLALLAARALSLTVGGLYFSTIGAIALYSVTGAVFNLGLIAWVGGVARRERSVPAAAAAPAGGSAG